MTGASINPYCTLTSKKYFPASILMLLLAMISLQVHATQKINNLEVCAAVDKEKDPVAILIDENGKISNGPINFGRFGYAPSKTDFYAIPTKYKVIISPARLKIETCHEGCLAFKPISPICRNAKLYAVSYILKDEVSFDTDRSWLPWKENHAVKIFHIEDPQSMFPVQIKYRFETRVIGEIYDGAK